MTKKSKSRKVLRLGFLPENDCASLVVAHELGWFAEQNLHVELSRESSCASLRDRILQGQLEAAHAPATLPFVLTLGLDFEQANCISGMVLSLQGNALTISQRLRKEGVCDADTLRRRIFAEWGRRTYTFGVPFPYSAQYFLLCQWLRSAGIVPHQHARIVVVPPEQMFPTLELGYLDGYCAGEPWNSVAAEAGAGVILATSAQLAPLHPEKALLVREDFAGDRADEHECLISVLREACAFCEQPGNRELICAMLAQPKYVNAPVECIRAGFGGALLAPVRSARTPPALNVFCQHHANEPSAAKSEWVADNLATVLLPAGGKSARRPKLNFIFRPDIFERSQRWLSQKFRPPASTRSSTREKSALLPHLAPA